MTQTSEARYLDEPPPDDDVDPTREVRSRLTTGANFILDAALDSPSLWGTGELVLWAELESLMISGPPGVGKTTIAQQLVLAAIGIGPPELLGFPVTPRHRVLYLAMDRPRQIAKSFRRMVSELDRTTLGERLAVWQGPPPADIAKSTSTLLHLAQAADADVIVIDSLKDAALGLANDEVGSAVNRAIQGCLVNGIDVLVLHHQTKRSGSGDGSKATTLADVYGSTWITAGAGSVFLVHGDAGDLQVELRHLKQPVEPVGPLLIDHDHHHGTTKLAADNLDPLAWLRAQRHRVTAQHLASVLAGPGETYEAKHVHRATRELNRLTRAGLAIKTDGSRGGPSGSTPATWQPAAHPGQENFPEVTP